METRTKKPTTRSHYLPQTYLKHFLLEDKLIVYKKGEKFFAADKTPEQRLHTVVGEEALVNWGLENNLYRIDAPGVTSDDIEDVFNAYGEDFLDDVIARFEGMRDGEAIEEEVKDKLCLFIASMRVRTPLFKAEVEESSSLFTKQSMSSNTADMDIAKVREILGEKGQNLTDEQIDSARKAIIDKKYDLQWPNELFLKQALSSLDVHADIFHDMNMVVLRTREDRYLVTTDNPVTYFVPQEKVTFYDAPRSLMSKYTEVFFPLTRNLGLHLSRQPLREIIQPAKREVSDIFNYNVSHNSLDFIFSPMRMKDLDEFAKEFHPFPFRLVIR